MILSVDEYYMFVSDLISRMEFDDRIANYMNKYSGLITEAVLAHLVVDELGRNITNYSKLYELRAGTHASIFATVSAPEPNIFQKKDGTRTGAEVFITDNTGTGRVLLWAPEHVGFVKDKALKIGTKLKILNAKVSRSSHGIDLNVSPEKFKTLIIDPPDFPANDGSESEVELTDISSISDDGPVNVSGTISWKSQLRTFTRKNSVMGCVLNLDLYDGTGTVRITLWDAAAKAAEEYNIGDNLTVINGNSKMHDNQREIHNTYRTYIKRNDDSDN